MNNDPIPRSYVQKTGASWREIGGKQIYFRSLWEYRYGCYLQWLKKNGCINDWEHEPKTFWFKGIKRGCVSYLPDFKIIKRQLNVPVMQESGVIENSHYWVEVKGYMDPKSKTKIKRFAKYFPHEKLVVIDGKWFRRNGPKLKGLVPGWE